MTSLIPTRPLFPKEAPLSPPDAARAVVLTASARQAWRMILQRYQAQDDRQVLLPAYIGFTDREGSGVFDPVKESGLGYRFYAVDEQLSVSTATLRAALSAGGVGVLLVVHWFGLPHANLQEVRALCDAFGVLLVEDCAHVAGPLGGRDPTLGRIGDAAFYSLHKIYGGSAGGALVWNRQPPDSTETENAPACPAAVLGSILANDVGTLTHHRHELYKRLVDGLGDIAGIDVMYPEIGDHVPHSCAVRVAGGLREKLYFALMERGVPLTALYYRLIAEIDESAYPEGYSVSRSILNYPVHHGVPAAVLPQVIAATRETMARLLA